MIDRLGLDKVCSYTCNVNDKFKMCAFQDSEFELALVLRLINWCVNQMGLEINETVAWLETEI